MSFSGVLTNDLGHVRGLWGSYAEQIDREEREWCAGLPAYLFAPWVDQMRLLDSLPPQVTGPPTIRTLDAELEPLLLSKARQFGLP